MDNTELKLRELVIREKEIALKEKELDNNLKITIIENLHRIGEFNHPDNYFEKLYLQIKNM